MTFSESMDKMLSMIPDDVDQREGSIIWHTLSPVAAMVAELWAYGDEINNSTIPDNDKCAGTVLTRKCAEHGVNRHAATSAVRCGIFKGADGLPAFVAIGAEFAAEGITYTVTERLSEGKYNMVCQTPGIVGNNYFGAILPLDASHRIGTATLADVIVPGEEEEKDDALRDRFRAEVNALPFGGNVDQYMQWILAIPGVGNAKVFPTPDNQGGRVHCVIVGPDNKPITQEFVHLIQETLDPEPHGKGLGTAPIGHHVTVSTVEEVAVFISAFIVLESAFTVEAVLSDVQSALNRYLAKLSFTDFAVRVAHVEAAILAVTGIKDISGTMLNGHASNILLEGRFDCFQIPTLGRLTLTEG